MELWIRSQEKDHLVKVEEINIEIDDDGFIGIWSYGSNKYLKWYLGHYATKERALEVLDEIQKYIADSFKENEISQFLGTTGKSKIVYEMPQE